jgi:phage FluMu gp28-like protein
VGKIIKPLTPVDKAFQYIIDSTFLPYQKDWLRDDSRFKIFLKSRQIGISETIAFEAFKNVIYKNENQYFVSASQRQSVELLDKFANWVDVFKSIGFRLNIESQSKTEMKINGCDVKSLTSNAITAQGFSGELILDEFSILPNAEQIYADLLPTITLGGSIKIVARPAGENNLFHEIWSKTHKYKKYSRHECNIHKAIQQGLQVDLDDIKENLDDDSFAEQYECSFVDSKLSFFPYDLLKTCYGFPSPDLRGDTYITIDVGRSNDRTAICVFVKTDDVYNLVQFEELHQMEFSAQESVISKYITDYPTKKCVIDKGFNPQLAENLEKKFKGIVDGVHCGDDFKHRNFSALKKMFEDKKILIPAEPELVGQLNSIKRENSGGKVKYTAPRNSRGHSDIGFSMMMLPEAIGNKKKIANIFLG